MANLILDTGNSLNTNCTLRFYSPNGVDGSGHIIDLSSNALTGVMASFGTSPWLSDTTGLYEQVVGGVTAAGSAGFNGIYKPTGAEYGGQPVYKLDATHFLYSDGVGDWCLHSYPGTANAPYLASSIHGTYTGYPSFGGTSPAPDVAQGSASSIVVPGGLQFNTAGTVDFGTSAVLDPGSGPWSFGIWLETSSANGTENPGGRATDSTHGYDFFLYNSQPYGWSRPAFNASFYQMTGGSISGSTRYFLAMVSGGTGQAAYLYLNRTQIATCTQTADVGGAGGHFILGNSVVWSVPFAGKMLGAMFAKGTAWSTAQITALSDSPAAGLTVASSSHSDSASNTIATSGNVSISVLRNIGASGSAAVPQSRTTQAFGKSLLSASRAMQASGNTFSTTSRLLAAVGKMIETASRPMQVFGGSGIESASAPVQTSGKSASQANAPLASIGASVTTALRSISSWGIGSLSTLRGLGTSGSSTDSASRITRSYGSSLSTIALGIGAWGELPPTPSKIEYWPYIGGSSLLTGSGTETNLLPGHYVEATVSHDEFVQIGDLLVSGVPEHVIQTIVAHHRANEFTVRFTNMGSYPETFTWSWQRRGRLLYYGRPGRDDADQ